MNIIIFSRDRAAQLDLLLRSMRMFWSGLKPFEVHILYRCSDQKYKDGYDVLIDRNRDLLWHRRGSDLKSVLLNCIHPLDKYLSMYTDDSVFKDVFDVNCKQFKAFDKDPMALCFSLRYHHNISWCFATGTPNDVPKIVDYKYLWAGLKGDYGYPMSVEGHIFRSSDIIPLLRRLNYQNPSELEALLARSPIKHPFIYCMDYAPMMNVPLNAVQTMWKNPHGNVSVKYLNWKFLKGYRLSLDPYIGYENRACHEILPIQWEITQK